MTTRDFILYTVACFVGTLAAVAVAGYVAKVEAQKALANAANSPAARLANVFTTF